eukprot:m.110364 g.110364  ORF g.110364 m.110364 type:complete len:69 (+) comp12883_c0_seq3:9496-9702(+)
MRQLRSVSTERSESRQADGIKISVKLNQTRLGAILQHTPPVTTRRRNPDTASLKAANSRPQIDETKAG